jgi:hypothetical protein
VLRIGYGIYSNEPLIRMLQLLAENPRPNARSITFLSGPAKPTLNLSDPFNESAAVSGGALPNVGGFENPLPQLPEISFDTPSFGAIGSALDARQIQLGMKLYF